MLTRNFTLILAFLLCTLSSKAQEGTIHTDLSLKSEILKMERNYAIYLPPDYESSGKEYPVLYLLHGAGDDHTGWIEKGNMKAITDSALAEGIALPMIIVMPDAQTVQRGYFNALHGNWNYEDFFFEEFIPHVEQKYRVIGTKANRAVAGLSMGGGGSFMYAMHHPELFVAAAPLSAYVGPLSLDDFKRYNPDLLTRHSEKEIQDYYAQHNALSLLESVSPEKLNTVGWYIDCGDDDFLYEGNSRVHILMRQKEIAHEYRVRDGAHDWNYWQTALPEVLRFVSSFFGQPD
ncbi:alpha/beta hydrolase [Croceiramulus getboli]|nr:alpha/beta hydrolase-fold protein [Flavobacteriaceae bacterium YJPT1-3]